MPDRRTSIDDPWPALCQRLHDSDRTALESVFRLIRAGLLRYVGAIVQDSDLAHDLVQDVFVALWGTRHSLDPMQPLKPYLYRMARNRALRHLRDTRTHARKEDLLKHTLPTATDPGSGPDANHDTRVLQHRLRQWVEALPDRQREALVLSRFHQLSHREIAAIMQISPRTVNNHIMRALDTLQEHVQAFEATSWNP